MEMKKMDDYESVYSASGMLDAEMMKNLLESFEIDCILLGESIGSTYGLTVTPAGGVEVMVRQEDVTKAQDVITKYQDGELEED
jgi:predicted Fe-Mo cluster-binding NifX family protein